MSESSRYPYTYACDYIRILSNTHNWAAGSPIPSLSRAQASRIRQELSKVLGLDDYDVACKLADAYLVKKCGWEND